MLYEIQKELGEQLVSRGCPIPVVYGPERVDTSAGLTTSERIVLQYDRDGGDGFAPGKQRKQNPKQRYIVLTGSTCRIYAADAVTNPAVQDHERRALMIRDMILNALDPVVKGGDRNQGLTIVSGGLLTADQLEQRGLKQWPGVVYEMRLEIHRGTVDVDWDGGALSEITFGDGDDISITSRTTVLLRNGDGTTETACGVDP